MATSKGSKSKGVSGPAPAAPREFRRRARMISPNMPQDTKIIRMPLPARWLFVCCIIDSDDEGWFQCDPAHLKAVAFPGDNLTFEDVRALFAHLEDDESNGRRGLLDAFWECQPEPVAHFRNWELHQKIRSDYFRASELKKLLRVDHLESDPVEFLASHGETEGGASVDPDEEAPALRSGSASPSFNEHRDALECQQVWERVVKGSHLHADTAKLLLERCEKWEIHPFGLFQVIIEKARHPMVYLQRILQLPKHIPDLSDLDPSIRTWQAFLERKRMT